MPETQAFDDAGGNGDDVLERTANLHAHHIVAPIQAEIRTAEFGQHQFSGRQVQRRRNDSRRQLLRHLARKTRPGEHDDRPARTQFVAQYF